MILPRNEARVRSGLLAFLILPGYIIVLYMFWMITVNILQPPCCSSLGNAKLIVEERTLPLRLDRLGKALFTYFCLARIKYIELPRHWLAVRLDSVYCAGYLQIVPAFAAPPSKTRVLSRVIPYPPQKSGSELRGSRANRGQGDPPLGESFTKGRPERLGYCIFLYRVNDNSTKFTGSQYLARCREEQRYCMVLQG